MAETYLHPSGDQLAAMAASTHDGPLVMVNLLRFADGGLELYRAYGEAAQPFLAKANATLRYVGDIAGVVIGPVDPAWDEIILVEYPSVQNFLEMAGDEDYPSELRTGALVDSRLYFSIPQT